LNLPDVTKVILSIFLLDFGSYCFHNLQHKIPILWRFHRVHHSDLYLNTSSALRFHPLDVILSQGIFFCIWIPIIGVPISAFIIYTTVALSFVVMQHTNLKFPAWMEKYGRYVFSTPGWHKIHHANEQKFTDSHYGDVFTFWDRIFSTWHPVQPEDIKFGLKEFEEPEKQKTGFLIRSPFMNL
jgi:sterol desaturase/sphingolipid hydroxylase (fatty acid hydroxylase superfamily)